MAKKTKANKDAEAFVRSVLVGTFKQKVDPETLRSVAQKVSEAVGTAPKKVAHA